ncbi:hypothetical protein FJT64_003500 [Amphibalanus amphitrite]|uniref:Uncharacterized protein n=1 Tax=Amphibalanus amphitrite TaxID=1232801 RepID=A0A6A4VX13_AMPAM|nr:hypothetical protein FJT64_003500 [Amphibalanus amphitrite]
MCLMSEAERTILLVAEEPSPAKRSAFSFMEIPEWPGQYTFEVAGARRTLLWRVTHDTLQLTEESTDVQLANAHLRLQFPDSPVLEGRWRAPSRPPPRRLGPGHGLAMGPRGEPGRHGCGRPPAVSVLSWDVPRQIDQA